jgi:hypothetical protein
MSPAEPPGTPLAAMIGMALALHIPTAWVLASATARSSAPPGDSGWYWSWPYVVGGAAIVLAVGIAVAWGVRYLEAQRERDATATRLESAIVATLGRESGVGPVPVVPTVRIGKTGPIEVALTGTVPSPAERDTVVRLAEREVSRLGRGARIDDRRLTSSPPAEQNRQTA